MDWIIYIVISMIAVTASLASNEKVSARTKRIVVISCACLLLISVIVNFIINGMAEGVLGISLSCFAYSLGRKQH